MTNQHEREAYLLLLPLAFEALVAAEERLLEQFHCRARRAHRWHRSVHCRSSSGGRFAGAGTGTSSRRGCGGERGLRLGLRLRRCHLDLCTTQHSKVSRAGGTTNKRTVKRTSSCAVIFASSLPDRMCEKLMAPAHAGRAAGATEAASAIPRRAFIAGN